jgi:sterol desaturase/sphingolipid hydroxylase (fatty acid hydroxylase superfamily)
MESRAIATEIILATVVFGSFIVMYLVEVLAGKMKNAARPKRDAIFTLFGMFGQSMVPGVIIGTLAGMAMLALFPAQSGSFAGSSLWLTAFILFAAMEFFHYVIHRYAHEWRWMWKLHRTHHSGMDMNVGLLYRYNIFWLFLLPQPWFGAFALYTGMYEAYAIAIFATYSVNVLTHTAFRWDLYLRAKAPWSEPLWWLIERVITLPDTHHAHHAYGKGAHPNGNYAVSLFIYDVIFGTAKIPNQRQSKFGLPISPRLHWAEEMFWPAIKKPLLPKPAKSVKPVEASAA